MTAAAVANATQPHRGDAGVLRPADVEQVRRNHSDYGRTQHAMANRPVNPAGDEATLRADAVGSSSVRTPTGRCRTGPSARSAVAGPRGPRTGSAWWPWGIERIWEVDGP
jgi:hypothetical protein